MLICNRAKEWLTLSFLPGIGCALINTMVRHFRSPVEVLSAGERLTSVPGIGPRLARILTDPGIRACAEQRADEELERVTSRGISLLSQQCDSYPALLRSIPDPPALLYAKGDVSALNQPAVALVGSRAASGYGRRVSRSFAGELADNEIAVVSGAAYGVDAEAHSGALNKNGRTVAVLGCGVDVVYPAAHGELLDAIAAGGVVVSEYPLGTRPEGFRFPARNRIISGLSAGVVIVEASERSGSLITATLALDQGRDVFAVPGRIDSVKSAGCHRLIQQGAFLVRSAKDVMAELGFGVNSPDTERESNEAGASEMWNEGEEAVLAAMDVYPVDMDTLVRTTGIAAGEMQAVLLQLELKGRIRQISGRRYELAVIP